MSEIMQGVWDAYVDKTPQRTKLVDVFMAFLVFVGGVQFVYCVLAGNYVSERGNFPSSFTMRCLGWWGVGVGLKGCGGWLRPFGGDWGFAEAADDAVCVGRSADCSVGVLAVQRFPGWLQRDGGPVRPYGWLAHADESGE